jgi:uncharacterized protein (TIGR03437 family)
MLRAWLALGSFCCGVAWAAAPSYSADDILQASNYAPGPFAPNSVVSIFGTDLARSEYILSPSEIRDNTLPTELNYTRVYVDDTPVPLFYVNEHQINFLIPSRQSVGPAVVRVMRAGISGPKVTISVVDAAPALFLTPSGYTIASHRDYSLVSPDSPAQPGEVIFVWATGLGKTIANPLTGELPPYISEIVNKSSLQVLLDGVAVDPADILYAGLTPQSAGLYQINLKLPDSLGADPEIRVAIGAQTTPAGLKVAVQ